MSIEERLEVFLAAWRAQDVEAILRCFSENGVYAASIGPEPGARAQGRTAIRSLVEKMFAHDTGTEAIIEHKVMMPNSAFWKWRYERPDGPAEIGCDFFEFSDGLITLKDAYRKTSLLLAHSMEAAS